MAGCSERGVQEGADGGVRRVVAKCELVCRLCGGCGGWGAWAVEDRCRAAQRRAGRPLWAHLGSRARVVCLDGRFAVARKGPAGRGLPRGQKAFAKTTDLNKHISSPGKPPLCDILPFFWLWR